MAQEIVAERAIAQLLSELYYCNSEAQFRCALLEDEVQGLRDLVDLYGNRKSLIIQQRIDRLIAQKKEAAQQKEVVVHAASSLSTPPPISSADDKGPVNDLERSLEALLLKAKRVRHSVEESKAETKEETEKRPLTDPSLASKQTKKIATRQAKSKSQAVGPRKPSPGPVSTIKKASRQPPSRGLPSKASAEGKDRKDERGKPMATATSAGSKARRKLDEALASSSTAPDYKGQQQKNVQAYSPPRSAPPPSLPEPIVLTKEEIEEIKVQPTPPLRLPDRYRKLREEVLRLQSEIGELSGSRAAGKSAPSRSFSPIGVRKKDLFLTTLRAAKGKRQGAVSSSQLGALISAYGKLRAAVKRDISEDNPQIVLSLSSDNLEECFSGWYKMNKMVNELDHSVNCLQGLDPPPYPDEEAAIYRSELLQAILPSTTDGEGEKAGGLTFQTTEESLAVARHYLMADKELAIRRSDQHAVSQSRSEESSYSSFVHSKFAKVAVNFLNTVWPEKRPAILQREERSEQEDRERNLAFQLIKLVDSMTSTKPLIRSFFKNPDS